jgi:hypothetical protein
MAKRMGFISFKPWHVHEGGHFPTLVLFDKIFSPEFFTKNF